jgi:ABC-type uncharacterized transport system substrate-binding protein
VRVLVLLILPFLLWAHPHTFVDIYPQLHSDTIEIKWRFDEMSSNMLIMDFDTNRDGQFSQKESDLIKSETFVYLKDYNYYTYLFTNKKVEQPSKLITFKATINGSKVEYFFTLSRPNNLKRIEFYDKELFSAFVLKKEFLTDKKLTIKEIDNDYYFGYALELK